jgi:hypothetical protein
MVIPVGRLPRNRCLGARLAIAKPREASQGFAFNLNRSGPCPARRLGGKHSTKKESFFLGIPLTQVARDIVWPVRRILGFPSAWQHNLWVYLSQGDTQILFFRNKLTDLIENKGSRWTSAENKPTVWSHTLKVCACGFYATRRLPGRKRRMKGNVSRVCADYIFDMKRNMIIVYRYTLGYYTMVLESDVRQAPAQRPLAGRAPYHCAGELGESEARLRRDRQQRIRLVFWVAAALV